ncbi:pantoate--beta-alanine ligase [Metallumcola ferriviriculae]|uniref:Pantothenate synthetase n=1 Tax=Metallumcola ferriviriculae TaxID=3039180 RepID=A0AAU0UJJ5_9FIRM|nr:pantoate--beta-alanine ligase [Desulfitibacteraceae bacterium MK1]
MKVVRTIKEIREALAPCRPSKTVGLVPTMGYFHVGHLSLMAHARKECDLVVTSLFVNPTQFGQGEDFESYPRDEKRDFKLARDAGVDIIFTPGADEMYEDDFGFYVQAPEELTNRLCGASRPGHFQGVATVVTKLFNIIQPQRAYFGQKDLQQLVVIKRMVKDLNQPVEVVGLPIIREADGLALSSRNVYLSPDERHNALALYQTLRFGRELLDKGLRNTEELKTRMKEFLKTQNSGIRLDYLEVLNVENLSTPKTLAGSIALAGAIWLGKTRLIDNIILEV